MSTLKSASKKRKRDATSSNAVVFQLSAPTPGTVGPILVSYPALHAPPATAFQCYAQKKAKNEGGSKAQEEKVDDQDMLVVGETGQMEFVSNEAESRRVADAGCRYLIAVHNRRTSTLSILPTAKSPHILKPVVKVLKSIPSSIPTPLQYKDARNALGETFGTKKAKANIRAEERNRVDVSAMEGVMNHLQLGIDKGAVGLLTTDEAREAADSNRLIPPFDAITDDPADVYPLHSIIPEVEWRALSVSQFEQAETPKEQIALLPFRWSKWINYHLNNPKGDSESSKARKKNMKIIFYIAAMLKFRQAVERGQKGLEKEKVAENMPGVPSVVTDSLLARFTEVARGSTSHTSTTTTQTNLLTHIFALCLKVDNFATDTSILAHDLSMTVAKVNQVFKTLGCKISVIGERERTRLGLPDSSANTKRAILHAPVVFPKPRALNRRK